MNVQKVDLIIQYALAYAGEQDYGERELGPIHLLKYIYIGDLAYAERNQGESFTGISWRFHKFGPWSFEAFERIQPALLEVGAKEKRITHPKYEDDILRWELKDESLLDTAEKQLSHEVTFAIQKAVRNFGADTPSLLNYVYLTRPMLTAAPGDDLDFINAINIEPTVTTSTLNTIPLDKKEQKKRKKKLKELRERIQNKIKMKASEKNLVSPTPAPRYDKVFCSGIEWLDDLAGEHAETQKTTAVFSDDIWKSLSRFDPDVP
jgi:hypothetical protein